MAQHTIDNSKLVNRGYGWVAPDVRIHVEGTRAAFEVGCIRRGEVGRKVTQGPLVQGPWAWAISLPSVMAANPEHGTWGEIRRARESGNLIEAAVGDTIVVDDVTYRIEFARGGRDNQNLELKAVE